ncbi:Cellobiose dehydrogenase [Madurella mycetomatis]|uniref:Cellobiose dehydrogenase n=1 Tax=Madurella mycetomatis TaxID=100816 RepID=A0A175VNE2_9PEZI|nr:Cellobiose dehydrogenase [Madurella mycetomatis]
MARANAVVAAAAASAVYQDPDTGLVFSSDFRLYKADGRGITFRVAIPADAQSYTAYDAVVQLVVPNDVGWAGLAWGGAMPRNPLLVAWRDYSNNVVLSSRMATGHVMPQPYSGAEYTLIRAGTKSNSTHWQVTALCRGCTSWQSSGATRYLSPRGGNRLAFAYSPSRPSNPTSPSSSIPIHEVHGYWSHDFSQAANPNFEATVARLTS